MFELANTSNRWDWCYSPSAFDESPVNRMSQGELVQLLDSTISSWNGKEIRPSHVYSIIELVNRRIRVLDLTYSNDQPIPICYFSNIQTIGALMAKVYLETHNVATSFHGINNKVDLELLVHHWNIQRPSAIIFSFSSFQYIDVVQQHIEQLKSLTNKVFAGGLIFNLNGSLRKRFPGFLFPADLPDLVKSITRNEL